MKDESLYGACVTYAKKKNVSGIYMLSLIFNPQLKDFLFSFP